MAAESNAESPAEGHDRRRPPTRAEELKAFFVITCVLAPALTFGGIIAYGFLVWMYQLVTGRLPGA